jgi:hypothetical protein
MRFVRAYLRESQEMVFDAHERAFAFFHGSCRRGIYDNMKTAVDAVFIGKARRCNRRFEQMCSHHLVEPVACTPASGWEKGQVENQVGVLRQRFFTPRLRFADYAALNAWLAERCIRYASEKAHPEQPGRTIFDRYSVPARALGRPVEIQAYAERLVLRQDGEGLAEHARRFGRGQTVYDPWHYVPVLNRKPGALRNGAPFKVYRLYEIMQVYGMPLKALIHEKFGDGIMSAIDLTLDADKEPDPRGDRVRVTMFGKFLPYKKW